MRGGADLVLELPLPWAIASAEGFAAGGVGVLAATGAVDTLVFGSECGDTETLKAVAAALESESFAAYLRQGLQEGVSFAAASIEDILAAAKSKRYAYARLRRLLLAVYLGVTPEDTPQRVPYLRVLACNARGREVLRCMKTTAAAPILTKSAQVRRLDADAQRLFALTARAEEQYTLAYPSLAAAKPGSAWTTTPVIL